MSATLSKPNINFKSINFTGGLNEQGKKSRNKIYKKASKKKKEEKAKKKTERRNKKRERKNKNK